MKFFQFLPFLLTLSAAAPAAVDVRPREEVEAASIFRNELINGNSGSCPGSIFIFARGTLELDNMVKSPYAGFVLPSYLANFS